MNIYFYEPEFIICIITYINTLFIMTTIKLNVDVQHTIYKFIN